MNTTDTTNPDLNRNRLPTLHEVLTRRTLPPVDLFNLYIYMRDEGKYVDSLDFWLDVNQHLVLCRHYVRELHRSTLIETPDPTIAGSKRSSAILDNLDLDPANEGNLSQIDEKAQNQRVSAFLRSENGHSPHGSTGSQQSNAHTHTRGPSGERPPRPSFMTSNHNSNSSPGHTVSREDLMRSAEKILYTYVLPGSEREIALPRQVQESIITAIEEQGRDDPQVFDGAKDWAFQAMEREAFPAFLRAKALGNLTRKDAMFRLIIGLVSLFGGFWTGFALVFLNQPRHIRCWVIFPFAVGSYLTMCHQYNIDPILALLGSSESTDFHWLKIREPYIRQLLNKRAMMVLVLFLVFTVVLSVIFIFVPGNHL
ncbi:MAG: Bud site selection protein, Revert to axial protein 1 [Cirrosporium novae-zelandiae]|nr:MAG: Bud site selection protein, Revert to axial protein 1 [Cirrosporium novae-zelandiae]